MNIFDVTKSILREFKTTEWEYLERGKERAVFSQINELYNRNPDLESSILINPGLKIVNVSEFLPYAHLAKWALMSVMNNRYEERMAKDDPAIGLGRALAFLNNGQLKIYVANKDYHDDQGIEESVKNAEVRRLLMRALKWELETPEYGAPEFSAPYDFFHQIMWIQNDILEKVVKKLGGDPNSIRVAKLSEKGFELIRPSLKLGNMNVDEKIKESDDYQRLKASAGKVTDFLRIKTTDQKTREILEDCWGVNFPKLAREH